MRHQLGLEQSLSSNSPTAISAHSSMQAAKTEGIEQRYSQFEREALAVKWPCQTFNMFLYGTQFELCTYHKPLITVLGPNSNPPLQEWNGGCCTCNSLTIIRHIWRKNISADVLSRLPVGEVETADAK